MARIPWVEITYNNEGLDGPPLLVQAGGLQFTETRVLILDRDEIKLEVEYEKLKSIEWASEKPRSFTLAKMRKAGLTSSYQPWTENETEQLRAEVEKQLPWDEIAKLHSRTVGAVFSAAKKASLVPLDAQSPSGAHSSQDNDQTSDEVPI